LFPASGAFGDVLAVTTKIDRALLFALYGVGSPPPRRARVARWRLNLLVLAATFVPFRLLGLAAHVLVPSGADPACTRGVLVLCLVPSTVQSSIAFTPPDRPGQRACGDRERHLSVEHAPAVVLTRCSGACSCTPGSLRTRRTDRRCSNTLAQLMLPFVVGSCSALARGLGRTPRLVRISHFAAARFCWSSTPHSREA